MKTVVVLPVVLALAFVAGLVFLLPVTFEFFYSREEKDDLLVCILRVPLKKSIYQIRLEDVISDNLFSWKTDINHYILTLGQFLLKFKSKPSLISFFKEINKANQFLLKNIHCKKLHWSTVVGLSDAAWTAIITGVLWNLKTLFYYNFRHNAQVEFRYPEFQVKPVFGRPYLALRFKCIFVISLGHIILTGIKFLSILAIHGLKRGNQIERPSNRGFNENSNGKPKGNGRCQHGSR